MAPTLRAPQHIAPKCRKIKFTELEDQKILSLVGSGDGSVNWELVSLVLGTRSPRQCKDRFHAYLAPGLNKSEWTDEEDQKLIEMVDFLGQKWKSIAPSFAGRPEVCLKNRYRLLMRRNKKGSAEDLASEEKKEGDYPVFAADDSSFKMFEGDDPFGIGFYEDFGFFDQGE